MSSLLTFNGVPPRIIGTLTPEQQREIVTYPWPKERHDSPRCKSEDGKSFQAPAQMIPFERFATGTAEQFTLWGAKYLRGFIEFFAKQLDVGRSTFDGADMQPHSDARFALERLHDEQFLILRLLCVSSIPATFIDLTGQKDLDAALSPHRRIFQQALMEFELPQDWEKRVAAGDVPRWGPT